MQAPVHSDDNTIHTAICEDNILQHSLMLSRLVISTLSPIETADMDAL
ncbi:MAG TPA: hypothetical protein VFD54_01670 [Anaerolineales bacterium]|nr:hypothetical protein [Anaerolineales bacterium]